MTGLKIDLAPFQVGDTLLFYFNRANAKVSDSPSLLFSYGRLLFLAGKIDEARAIFQRLAKMRVHALNKSGTGRVFETNGSSRQYNGQIAFLEDDYGLIDCANPKAENLFPSPGPLFTNNALSVGDHVTFALEFNSRGPIGAKRTCLSIWALGDGVRTRLVIIHLYLDSEIRVYHDAAMKKKKIQISAGESQVMEALWHKSPLTPEEIIAATAKANDWGPGTVRTLITRLLHKGALAGARQDGGYFYKPLISRADYVGTESQMLLDRLFGGQVAPLVAHFATQQKLTAADIRKLRKLIAELEE